MNTKQNVEVQIQVTESMRAPEGLTMLELMAWVSPAPARYESGVATTDMHGAAFVIGDTGTTYTPSTCVKLVCDYQDVQEDVIVKALHAGFVVQGDVL